MQGDNDWLVDKLAQIEKQRQADEHAVTDPNAQRHSDESFKNINQKCEHLEVKMKIALKEQLRPQDCNEYRNVLNDFRLA